MRDALLGIPAVVSGLPLYEGQPAIFTRRPAPLDAPYPMIMVSPDIVRTDDDGISDFRPVVTRDIIVYGRNDSSNNYRAVELMA